MKRLPEDYLAGGVLPPANRTNTVPGAGATLEVGEDQEVTAVCFSGAIGASAACTFKIQESDDDSTWADIAGATCAFDASDDNAVQLISVRPTKRYARAYLVGSGTVANGVLCGAMLMVKKRNAPVTQAKTAVVV